jgi:hypothetical protein
MEISSLPLPTSPVSFQSSCPLRCVLVFSSLFISQFFWEGVQSAQGVMLVYPRGGWGNAVWCLVLTCLVCWMSPKLVWSQCLVVVAALLFSQCNVAWRSFLWARGSDCQSFDSPWCFISSKCGSSVSARFLIHGDHIVCFCILVTILDPLIPHFLELYLRLSIRLSFFFFWPDFSFLYLNACKV